MTSPAFIPPMPQSFGRYKVKHAFQQDGRRPGVYHCYDDVINRDVVVKVLPVQALENDMEYARFKREASFLTRLEHPSIVPVYDYGIQDKQPYLVMRYMGAGTLAERLCGGALVPEGAVHILEVIADALDFVHENGIIHRDIKPANILQDDRAHFYLADFGIATLLQEQGLQTTQGFIGTARYASPEQAQGQRLTPASDIYSLGVVAFEMFTGGHPFDYSNDPSMQGMLRQHIHQDPLTLRTLDPGLPPALDMVVAGSLSKEPGKRPRTAGMFAESLKNAFAGSSGKIERPPIQTWAPASQDIWVCAYCGYTFRGSKQNCPVCGHEHSYSGGKYV